MKQVIALISILIFTACASAPKEFKENALGDAKLLTTAAPTEKKAAFDVMAAWRAAQKSGTFTLPKGEVVVLPARLYSERKQGIVVDLNGGVLDGSKLPVIRASTCIMLDSVNGAVVKNGEIRNCPQNGVLFGSGSGFEAFGLKVHHIGNVGIETGHASNVYIHDVETWDAYGTKQNIDTKHGSHGIYVSETSKNIRIENVKSHDNTGAAVQTNCVPGGGVNVTIRNVEGYRNGKFGGACINTSGLIDSVVENNHCYANLAGGISAWDDGNARFPEKNTVIRKNRIEFAKGVGRYCVTASAKGNRDLHVVENECVISGSFWGDKYGVVEDRGNVTRKP